MFDQFTQLGKEIYVYKNFLSESECLEIVNILDGLSDEQWIPLGGHFTHFRTDPFSNIVSARARIESLLPDGLMLGKSVVASRLVDGDSWGEHSDVHDFFEIEELAATYIEGTPYVEKELSVYGTVLYFNNFEGGEIYYPTQNIEYHPSPGDLVIHSSSPVCLHGVRPVIKGPRYSYSNHIYKNVKVPADVV